MANDTHYIYRVRPTRLEMLTDGPTEHEAAALDGHLAYLEKLAQEDVVLLAGRTQTADADTFGIVIFRAASLARAQRVVDEDPAVSGGVMTAQLFPYHIAVASKRLSG